MRWMLLILVGFAWRASADDGNIWDDGRQIPREAIVTVTPEPVDVDINAAPMALRLQGVIGVWRGRELGQLRGGLPPDQRTIGFPANAEPVCVVHLRYGRNQTKRVEIVRAIDGTFVAREIDPGADGQLDIAELDRIEAASLVMGLNQYRGSFDEQIEDPIGEDFRLAQPITGGWFTFDQHLLSERMWGAAPTEVNGTHRFLDEESWQVRLPHGYDPRHPAGLLVWISPTDSGSIPQVFDKALDELGLICVGANDSGNDRLISDRYQLAFDGVATCMRRYHVDPRRVYVTGFSGGGRVSSMLHGAFADVFSGSVPMGGANSYKRVAVGDGTFWPPGYRKPSGPVFAHFREQRMACITGDADFNEDNVKGVVLSLTRDAIDAKVFDIENLGHELAGADDILQAVSWMDEPYRRTREKETEDAAQLMANYKRRFEDRPVQGEGQPRLLNMVMETGPWTDAAWEAAEALGLLEPRPAARNGESTGS